jgi:hypothetical protein
MASQIEVKGVNRTVADPVDVQTLHVKDVGEINKNDLNDFVTNYQQPPLSRFFGMVDTLKVRNSPDISKKDLNPKRNASFSRAFDITDYNLGSQELNSFDTEVVDKIFDLMYMYVNTKMDEVLENYSSWSEQFKMTWIGERSNPV